MRYRPLGKNGQVVSAVSLVLEPKGPRRNAADWVSLIYAALECGISSFELRCPDRALAEGLTDALAGVDRRLVFVALRLAESAAPTLSLTEVGPQVREALSVTGLEYVDALLLRGPASPRELDGLKSSGLVRALGVASDDEIADAMIASGGLDVLAAGYSLLSDWSERRRIRNAVAVDMAVFGYDSYPRIQLEPLMERGKKNRRSNPLAGVGGYRFLESTHGWTAEELCLAYALTEPSLATVMVHADSPRQLERLAAVPDRDLPPGVAAQIEMARFRRLGEDEARRSA